QVLGPPSTPSPVHCISPPALASVHTVRSPRRVQTPQSPPVLPRMAVPAKFPATTLSSHPTKSPALRNAFDEEASSLAAPKLLSEGGSSILWHPPPTLDLRH